MGTGVCEFKAFLCDPKRNVARLYSSEIPKSRKWTQKSGPAVLAPAAGPAGFGVQLPGGDRIGLMAILLGIYLFMHAAPFAEILAIFLHIHLPIVAVMCALVTVLAAFTMRLSQFTQSPVAIPWLALLAMFFLASAFGLHPR